MNVAPRGAAKGNFAVGRKGHRIEAIVIHLMAGSMEGTLSWFRNPASKVSAHYGVSRKGEVVRYVNDEDTAYHAGTVDHPTAELVLAKPGVSPNLWSIGIEHEGTADQEPTAAQMVASAELVASLCARYSIPIDAKHIIPHRAIRASKTCPGKIDVLELITLARGAAAPALSAKSMVGARRWSEYLGTNIVVTRWASDSDWSFLRESDLAQLGLRGTVAFSDLPPAR